MTKKEAIDQLITDFKNRLIADNFQYMDDNDIAMCKALGIEIPKS